MNALFSILLLFLSCSAFGQKVERVYRNPADSSFNCYLKLFPTTDRIKGLIVRDVSNLPDVSKKSLYRFSDLCSQAGFMTLVTNTSKQFPELFTADSTMQLLDTMIQEVVQAHHIPKEHIFIGGMSSSGTRALRFAQYCARGKSSLKIRGVFAVDAPLDLARFYHSAYFNKKNFKAGMLWEANWMVPLLDTLLGGSPSEYPQRYKNASVFSHGEGLGGNAFLLKNTPIILFHEPDIDWWIRERGCSYYDINSYDLVAFTVFLNTFGSKQIELVTTSNKGFDFEGNRKPHSWSIVDEDLLIRWIKNTMTPPLSKGQ